MGGDIIRGSVIKKIYNNFMENEKSSTLTLYINSRKQYFITKKDKVLISHNEVIINEKIAVDNDIIKAVE